MDAFGFLKVAAAVPHLGVGDCDYNTERMAALAEEAAQRGVEIAVFPELGVTGYTCGDLLLQSTLLDAADEAFGRLVRATRKLPLTLIAGLPLRHGTTLYNCAAVFTQGRVLGVVPKSVIPGYSEFYEPRWFASGAGISGERIDVAGQSADFGTDLTFEVNGAEFGIEICEDLWTAAPPSSQLALNGAKVIFNLSASPESVGKHAYLRQLVAQQSGRAIAAYVYCSAGFGESTTDLVFAGNAVIAENGCILREAARFSPDEQLVVADVDIERLEFERRRNTSFRANEGATENTVIEVEIPEGRIAQKTEDLVGPYELHDFFLYNFLRAGYGPAKILLLAEQAFDGSYDRATILRWLTVFVRRFFTQQFKRSAMPDGPKVGSVTLSPRGDWRMPSDASAAAWLRELDML